MSTNGNGSGGPHEPRESPHDCRPDRFQRNRYYDGKPMFARDFAAEQEYHVDRLDTLARHVAGEGILDGLETTVVEEADGRLTVTVSAGLALDCCGRLLVVPDETERTLDDPGGNETNLYLVYGECVTETVPLEGTEGACRTDCEYNRVLEVVDVVQDETAPEFGTYKRIPEVEFPDPTTTTLEDPAPLFRMAETFHENGGTVRDCGPDERRVFLGTFTGDAPGAWERTDTVPLGYAYTADLLYATVANHLLETNPHRVGLEVEPFAGATADETGATLRVQGPEDPAGEVTVATTDPDLTIGNDGTQRITVEVPGLEGLRTRMDALEELLREQSVRYKRTAFSVVFERFAGTAVEAPARDVHDTAVDAIGRAPPRYVDPEEFVDFVGDVLPEEQTLEGALPGVATSRSITRYSAALRDLEAAEATGDPLRMAKAQDAVAEAAEWLRPIPEEEPEPEPELVCLAMDDVPEERRESFPIRIRNFLIRTENPDIEPDFTRDEPPEGRWKLRIPIGVDPEGIRIQVPTTSRVDVFVTVNGEPLRLEVFDAAGNFVTEEEIEGVETHRFEVEGDDLSELVFTPNSDDQFIVEVCVER